MKDESPVFELGFERLDHEKAGLYGDDAWVRRPGRVERVGVEE